MKFQLNFYETALNIAIEKENVEITKILLTNKSIGIYAPDILFHI